VHRIYETTFIVNPQTDNASIDQSVRAVADLITTNGGKIIKADHMGTRRLAYEIQGLTQGYYATFIFESEAKVLPILERHFKLEDAYIRHLLIRFDGDPRWLEENPQDMAERVAPAPMPTTTGSGRRPEFDGGGERRPEMGRRESRPMGDRGQRDSADDAGVSPRGSGTAAPSRPSEERKDRLTEGDEL
jgi:small subunit ribosomal protein S6